MKAAIHPKYYSEAEVSCACGNVFTIGSTKDKYRVEICYKCHPFFTGQLKFVDTLGRVDRFQKKQKFAASQSQVVAAQKKKKAEKIQEEKHPKSLREMLLSVAS